MIFRPLFFRALAGSFIISLLALNATAQTSPPPPPQFTATIQTPDSTRLENDPVLVSLAPVDEITTSTLRRPASPRLSHLNEMILAAIDERIGAPYHMGATGPYRFDCSGFVWSVFQSAGIDFERSSARSLWMSFVPARAEEELRFGTLVFFNNLKHVGIVADKRGFYHASSSQGVTYSHFNDYWLARIDGFRRVPLPAMPVDVAAATTAKRNYQEAR